MRYRTQGHYSNITHARSLPQLDCRQSSLYLIENERLQEVVYLLWRSKVLVGEFFDHICIIVIIMVWLELIVHSVSKHFNLIRGSVG